ncbi:MAG TPA: adenylate/guanylate cyclase domain-containing protein, partial [Pyrinomonadaceae bacterium]
MLFLDIVGFSKLFLAQQVKVLRHLEQVVRETEAFSLKEKDQLIVRSTGDGMALVFFTPNAVQAVECAEQIDKALRSKGSEFGLRTGLHTGPVFRITDINEEKNVAGGGINTAQRVMDCGDAGHILLSDQVADQLGGSPTWQAKLHDLGSVKVKHDQQVHLHNLYGDGVGNSETPKKLQLERDKDALKNEYAGKLRQQRNEKKLFGLAALFFLALAIGAVIYSTRTADLLRRGDYSVAVIPMPNSPAIPEVDEYIGKATDSLRVYLADNDSNLTILPSDATKAYTGADPFQAGKALKVQAVFTVEGKESASGYVITVKFHDVANNIACCEQEYLVNENNRPQKFSEMEHDAMSTIRLKHIPGEKRPAGMSPNADANASYLDALYYWKRRKPGPQGKPGDLEV